MPVVVALIVRAIIQMAVTLGLIELASKLLLPTLNKTISEVAQVFGVSEETAEDIVANEFLQFAEQIAVGVLVLRAKLPTKIAERLGFTAKGFNKRVLSPDTKNKIAARPPQAGKTLAPLPVPTVTEATSIINSAKATLPGFRIAYDLGIKTLGVTFLGFMVAGNFLDFGNWNSGAYQKTFQKIFAKVSFGLLVPDEDYRKTKTVSPEVFDKVYNTYKLEGAVGIEDPFKRQTVLFTRDNLIDVLDLVGAELLRTTQKAATKDVIIATQLMIVFSKEAIASGGIATPGAISVPTAQAPQASPPSLFVGFIDRGRLSAAKTFTPQMRERVSSAVELTNAVQENIGSFISALPGMLKFDIKLRDRVTAPDGTELIGTRGEVEKGISPTGVKTFRKFRNSFVVIDILILKNTGGETKIGEIIAGILDESKISPTIEQLVSLGNSLSKKMLAPDIDQIQEIQFALAPAGPVVVAPTITAPEAPTILPVTEITPGLSPTTAGPPRTPTGLTLEETEALQKSQLRTESKNELEEEAIKLRTQNTYVLPDGSIIRAGFNPDEAPTVRIDSILAGVTATGDFQFLEPISLVMLNTPNRTAFQESLTAQTRRWYIDNSRNEGRNPFI